MSDFDKFIRDQLNQNEDDDFRRLEGNWDKLSSRMDAFDAANPLPGASPKPLFTQLKYVHLTWGSIAASLLVVCIWLVMNQSQTQHRIEALEKQLDSLPKLSHYPAPIEPAPQKSLEDNGPSTLQKSDVAIEKFNNPENIKLPSNQINHSVKSSSDDHFATLSQKQNKAVNPQQLPKFKQSTATTPSEQRPVNTSQTESQEQLAAGTSSATPDTVAVNKVNDIVKVETEDSPPSVNKIDSNAIVNKDLKPAIDTLSMQTPVVDNQEKTQEDTSALEHPKPVKKAKNPFHWPTLALGVHGIASQEKVKFRGAEPFIGIGTGIQINLLRNVLSLQSRIEWTRAEFNMVNPRREFPYGPDEVKGPPPHQDKKIIGLEGTTMKRSFSLGLAYVLTQKTWLTPVVEAGFTWQTIKQDSATIQLLDIPNGNIEQLQSKPLPRIQGLNTFYVSAGLQKQFKNFTVFTHVDFNGLFNGSKPKPATEFNSLRFGIRYTL